MRIGIVGLGKMGSVFAERLIDAGHDLTVWNRTRSKAEALAEKGARVAEGLPELLATSDLVMTIVVDGAALTDVYEGNRGLLCGACDGKLFIEMSTVGPQEHVRLDREIRARGARLLECPVSGSVAVARNGQLLGFAGGDAADLEQARGGLDLLCRRIDLVGPVGTAAAIKLAINLPLVVYWQALGEALALCEGYDRDPAWLIDLFSESSGGPNVLKVRGPSLVKALKGEPVPVTADIRTLRKDLTLMLEEASARGAASPLVSSTLLSFGKAEEDGLGDMDCTVFPVHWAKGGNQRARIL